MARDLVSANGGSWGAPGLVWTQDCGGWGIISRSRRDLPDFQTHSNATRRRGGLRKLASQPLRSDLVGYMWRKAGGDIKLLQRSPQSPHVSHMQVGPFFLFARLHSAAP